MRWRERRQDSGNEGGGLLAAVLAFAIAPCLAFAADPPTDARSESINATLVESIDNKATDKTVVTEVDEESEDLAFEVAETTEVIEEDSNDLLFSAEETTENGVAQVAGETYQSLQNALNAANTGETVKLLDDVETAGNIFIQKSITLDLNGHKITSSGQSALCIYYEGNDTVAATVKNGTLSGGTLCTVWAYNTADLTLENVTVISAEDCGGIYDYGTKSSLTLNNCNITGDYFAIYHNGSTAGFTLTAENSTITSNSDSACAIYVSGSKANTAEDADGMNAIILVSCTVIGPTGIEGKYTNMKFTNCDITATAEQSSFEQYNNGSSALGFAVVSTDNSMSPASPAPSATITIDGGIYEGLVGLSNLISTDDYEDFREADITVASGTFSSDISDYVPDNSTLISYAHDGTTVYVAGSSINGVLENARDGDVVAVLKGSSIEVPDQITVVNRTGNDIIVNGTTVSSDETIVAHKAVRIESRQPTCIEEGCIEHWYCQDCNTYFADEALTEETTADKVKVAATGHTYGEWTVTKEASGVAAGEQMHTCTICGYAEIEGIQATGSIEQLGSDDSTSQDKSANQDEGSFLPAMGDKIIVGTAAILLVASTLVIIFLRCRASCTKLADRTTK